MSNVRTPSAQGQEAALSSLRWSDSEAAQAWLSSLEALIAHAHATTVDQLLPLRQRRLGHVEAERIIFEASRAIAQALAFAARGLTPDAAKG